jgi:hypothetical protein
MEKLIIIYEYLWKMTILNVILKTLNTSTIEWLF